jgi:hypothetical protein
MHHSKDIHHFCQVKHQKHLSLKKRGPCPFLSEDINNSLTGDSADHVFISY